MLLAPGSLNMLRTFWPLYAAWIDQPWLARLTAWAPIVGVLAIAVTSGVDNRPARVFGVAAIGGAVSYVLQGKLFGYHAVPGLAYGLITGVQVWSQLRLMSGGLVALAAIALWCETAWSESQRVVPARLITEFKEETRPTLLLVPFVSHGHPLQREVHRPWLAPVPSVWWATVPDAPAQRQARRALYSMVATAMRGANVVLVEAAPHLTDRWAPTLSQMGLADPSIAAVLRTEFGPVDSSGYLYRWERR